MHGNIKMSEISEMDNVKIFLGVYPQPFFDRIQVSINHYIELVKNNEPRFAQDEKQNSHLFFS